MEVISQYSIFQISGVGSSIQKAINSVFLITIKMSVFYLLWTYITHVVFDASIVVLPILFSSFIAACPFTGQHIVALPAAMELYCLQHRPLGALLLVIFQVAPSWLVDTAIYSEVRGGIHPWFTGLAVVGGQMRLRCFITKLTDLHLQECTCLVSLVLSTGPWLCACSMSSSTSTRPSSRTRSWTTRPR